MAGKEVLILKTVMIPGRPLPTGPEKHMKECQWE